MLACCRPLAIEVYELTDLDVLEGWKSPEVAGYRNAHGLKQLVYQK